MASPLFPEFTSKRHPAWDLPEAVRESIEASRIAPPSVALLPASTVPFPFEAKGAFVAGMVRARPRPDPRFGVAAFVPASLIRADLPLLPDAPFEKASVQIRIPASDRPPGVRVSREERRLEQRRRVREEAEAEAKALAESRLVATERALLSGGLWRAVDIAASAGIGQGPAQAALETLGASGRAVEVALGHWRSRIRLVDLSWEGRTTEACLLGHLLHGLSMDGGTVSRLTGLCPVEVDAAGKRLVAAGHAVPVGPASVRCPEKVRHGILATLGPSVLSPLGQRVVDDLFYAKPSRKVDVANRLGIGRGSVNRAIERLVEEGWLSSPAPDLFAVA